MTTPPDTCWPRSICQRLLCGLLLALCWLAPGAAAVPPLIATPAIVDWDAGEQQLDVTTIEQQWQLRLRSKQLLGQSSVLQNALYSLPDFYEGQVIGDTHSWIRLANDQNGDGSFTGHIYTGGSLYELEYRQDMGGHALTRLDQDIAIEDIPLPAQDDPVDDNTSNDPLSLNPRALPAQSEVAERAIKIGIVVDSRYNEHHNGRGLAHALGIINGVDGLYQSQLGLAVVVESFRVYDDPQQDPLRHFQGSVEQLLGTYRDVRSADEDMPADLALVHLFSGHGDAQKIIGLGWISTACRLDGYDLSMSTPFPYDMLLSAHEIAHNLGAVHDDDSACNSDPSVTGNEVMWSELSGNTRPTFSSCSLAKMSTVLQASCVTNNIDVGVAISAQSAGNAFQQDVTITVFNQDATRAAPQVVSQSEFPRGVVLSGASAGCSISGSLLTCQHGVIGANTIDALSVSAQFPSDFVDGSGAESQPVITTELAHGAFTDTEQMNNRASLQLSMDEAADGTFIATSLIADNPSSASGIDGRPADDATAVQNGGSAGLVVGSVGPLSLAVFGSLAWLFNLWRSAGRLRSRRPEPSL